MHTAFYNKQWVPRSPWVILVEADNIKLYLDSLKEGLTPVWIDSYEGLFICKGSLLFSNDLNLTGFFSLHMNLRLLLKTKLFRQPLFSCNYTVTDWFFQISLMASLTASYLLIKGTPCYLLCKWHLARIVTQVPLSALTLQRIMQTKGVCYWHSLQSFDK